MGGEVPSSARAVIFDMDGVLLDSEPLHHAALNRLLAAEGHSLTEEAYQRFIGWTLEATIGDLVQRFALRSTAVEYAGLYDAEVLRILGGPLVPAPGVVELISRIEVAGIPLAVASSSRRSWVSATLRSLHLERRFPVVVTGDDVARGKPDPDVFLLAARLLGLPPTLCSVIEDSPNGVAAAKAAGMWTVAVRTPATDGLSLDGADVVVPSLERLDLSLLSPATT